MDHKPMMAHDEAARQAREYLARDHPIPVAVGRVLLAGYEAAVKDIGLVCACPVCKHDPCNGGECPGYIDCQDPDAPLADFFRCVWRGPEPVEYHNLPSCEGCYYEQIGLDSYPCMYPNGCMRSGGGKQDRYLEMACGPEPGKG